MPEVTLPDGTSFSFVNEQDLVNEIVRLRSILPKTKYHAVMIDETGCEFGADVEAIDASAARAELMDQYPESRIAQLESPQDTARREKAMHDHIALGGDWDDEGRPIFHGPSDEDDWDDEDDWEDEEV